MYGENGTTLNKIFKKNKDFKLVSLTENRSIKKKINGIKPMMNSLDAFKKVNVIIDFTIPKCTLEVLRIAVKQKKIDNRNHRFYKKRGKLN